MVLFIWRFLGEPKATTTTDFKDVPKTAIYYDAVQWAAENGITNGTGNGNFSPDREVSRGMVVTMLNPVSTASPRRLLPPPPLRM